VVTQPDRPGGRKLQPQPSFVKQCATKLGLQAQQPSSLRDSAFFNELVSLKPDLVVVAAYGQILPLEILELPAHGCLNVHASILPQHRGAAPIQWALLNGDRETGVTIMKMDEGLDTGGMIAMARTPIGALDNAQTLHDRLAQMGADLLRKTLPGYVAGDLTPKPQLEKDASYARKIKKADGLMRWGDSAPLLIRRIRAFTPWPGAFTEMPMAEQRILKILDAKVSDGNGKEGEVILADESGIVVACGEQALRLLTVQREGSKRMAAADFLRGCPLRVGMVLGETRPG
jgi:methionyl-tRNA formyltransferase